MLSVIAGTWSLLLGILLLLVGNGMQGTVLGLRGAIEGFDAATMALVMSGYYVGFLIGSRVTPALIARVGHVRVFSALASLIAAAFVIYGAVPTVWAWTGMRCVAGLCFAGVYVVGESWLNDAATNETRGKALSLYMLVQMVGIIAAQFIVTLADPAGFAPFAIMSVLVSIAVTPMLMTADKTPAFRTTKPMSLSRLWRISPLGCVGTFMLGGIYAAIFSMGSVFGTARGLSVAEISTFVASIYVAGLIFQYPTGWLSDRMERRHLILLLTVIGAVLTLAGGYLASDFPSLLAVAFVMGGVANPLYALVIAYTNDFLDLCRHACGLGGAAVRQRSRGDIGTRHPGGTDDAARAQCLFRLCRGALRARRPLRALSDDPSTGASGGRAHGTGQPSILARRLDGGPRGGGQARSGLMLQRMTDLPHS